MTLAALVTGQTPAAALTRDEALACLHEAAGWVAVLQALAMTPPTPPIPDTALTPAEAAARLGVARSTLRNGKPLYRTFRLPGTRRYSSAAISEYLRDPDGYVRRHSGGASRRGRPALVGPA